MMKRSKSPEGPASGREDARSLAGTQEGNGASQIAVQHNPRAYSKISTFRGPNPQQLSINQQSSVVLPSSQAMVQVDKSHRKQTIDRERYDGSGGGGGGKMTQAAASTIVAISGLTSTHDGKRQAQKRKFRSNNPNSLKTQEDHSPPKIYLKKDNIINPQQLALGNNNNNYNNKSIQIDNQMPQNSFFSNVSTNQTLAGIVKIDSHRLSKLNNNRNLKSSMVLVTKDTIQTNKLTKLQSSRPAFTMGKSNLDQKNLKQQSCGPHGNSNHRPKIRDYSPIGEISNTRQTYLNIKPRLASQFDRGKECDETSNFSNLTVPSVPKQKTDQKDKKNGSQSHLKKQSFQVEKRNGRGIVLQDSHKFKQKSFDQQIQIGSGQIYKNQSFNELSIPAIEANSRLSIQQIAAQSNIDILNQQYAHGLQSTKKLEDKLCTISSSVGPAVDGEMTGRASDIDDNASMMALHTHVSAMATHGQRLGFASSITDERKHTQIENDGDDDPLDAGQYLTEWSLSNKQALPSLQSVTVQQLSMLGGVAVAGQGNASILPTAPVTSKGALPNTNMQIKIQQKNAVNNGVTDSPMKNSKGFHPLTSMSKSAVGSGVATTMISMNMSSDKNHNFQSIKSSMQDSSYVQSKFLKKKGESQEATMYAKNTFGSSGNLHQHHHSAYHSSLHKGGHSLNQRFSANFATSSDVYGAANRSKQKGSINDSANRYFGKNKFSMNSQQATKNINSVLNQIKEGGGSSQVDFKAMSSQQLDSFERKYSLSSMRGQKSFENNKMLKHQNIHIIDKNQKQIKMKSKRFLNNSVHQKVSGMQMSLPVSKMATNQGSMAFIQQEGMRDGRDGMLRNEADKIHRNLKQQLSRFHMNQQLVPESRCVSNLDHQNTKGSSKHLSISTSDNNACMIAQSGNNILNNNSAFLEDSHAYIPFNQGQDSMTIGATEQRATLHPQSHSHIDPKVFAHVLASSSKKHSPPLVKNAFAMSIAETLTTNPTSQSKPNLILASSGHPESTLDDFGVGQKQTVYGPAKSMVQLGSITQDLNQGIQMPIVQNSAKGGIQQLQMALQQNVKRKSIHGKKKRNVPVHEILDSLKLGQNNINVPVTQSHQPIIKKINTRDQGKNTVTDLLINKDGGLAASNLQIQQAQNQRRKSNRSSLQPQSRIHDNDNVIINSSRVNKTQKKSKLKIQDHTELESFRAVGERYREKHQGNNSSSNVWKKTSVSVKNNRKTLVVARSRIENNMGAASNTNFSVGSSNRDPQVNFSPNFPLKKKSTAVETQSNGKSKSNLSGSNVKVKLHYQNSSPQIISQTSFNKNSSIGQKLDTINEMRATKLSPDKIEQLEDEASSSNNNGLNVDPSLGNGTQNMFGSSTNRPQEEMDNISAHPDFVFNELPDASTGQGLTQTITILDNNLLTSKHQKTDGDAPTAAQTSSIPLLNHQVFNEYQDFSALNRDYIDITDGEMRPPITNVMTGAVGPSGNHIRININKDRGILDDLSYFSQDLEELSQNNNMCLKFYDFNGFKSSLSHRGGLKSSKDNSGPVRPDETARGSRRNRNQPQQVPNLQLEQAKNNQNGSKGSDCLKTTESRSLNNIARRSPSSGFHPAKLRTVRPPDSQQMLRRPQQVKQSRHYFEELCKKNEGNFLAQQCSNQSSSVDNKQDEEVDDKVLRIKESGGNKSRVVSSPYFGQKVQEA